MSPASKSKSKEKKAGKDSQKASSKPLGAANAGSGGVPASAYNPMLGTFHNLETMPSVSSSPLQNGRFRNIDETDDHSGGSHGTGVEYDSVSNNGSWSGESEDHKEKNPNPSRQEAIPGGDNDKREKIRQKNERKHQRQKERRNQELHEKCTGYLMSRKLESLAQQLVAMGFSHERATMALILNEGKVEESVNWLFEGAEEANKNRESPVGGGNLKIDISEELARIAELEIRFKCTKQEVERQVVAAEGDLQKATEALRTAKHDPPSATPKTEETGDPLMASNGKTVVGAGQSLAVRPQLKLNSPLAMHQQRDERDFNYMKPIVIVGGPSEPGNKNLQPLKRIQPKLDWAKPQQTAAPAEKRWPNAATNTSLAYSVTSPPQASPSPAKTETRYMTAGNEFKSLQPSVREPVVMMQRPKSVNTKQIPATSISSSPPAASNWFPTSGVETAKSNGFMPHIPSTRNLSSNNLSSSQMYHQLHYQPQQQFAHNTALGDSPGTTSRGNSLWNRTGASPTLAAASSLGLFSGLGSSTGTSGASSPVDWSSGSAVAQLDYTNIDWSLDRGLSSPRPGGLPFGLTSSLKNTHLYDPNANGLGVKPAMRFTASNGNGVPIMGLQDGGIAAAETSGSGSREWTSPFEGNDLFTLSRQFVSSPSL